MSIKGPTVGTTIPRTNYNQTDPAKADYLKGKEDLDKKIQDVADNAQAAAGNAQTAADNAQTAADEALNGLKKAKAGFIYPLASATVPDGFLLCDGAAYSRTEYPELFAAIGIMYGEGDGSTTFNVPGLQTRVPVGAGGDYALGDTGGEETHTLTVGEMPKHDHVLNIYAGSGSVGGGIVGYSGAAGGSQYSAFANVGGGQPHNNMQPYTVINYIIATGKYTGVSVSDIVLGAQAIPLGVEYGGTGATNPATARHNLEITPDNIGALSTELLWENGDIASDFSGPDAELRFDTSANLYIAEFVDHYGDGNLRTRILVSKGYTTSARCFINLNTSLVTRLAERRITIDNGMAIFTDAIYKDANSSSGETRKNYLIPSRIYAVRGASE